jgi:hypothetical protein
MPRSYDCSPTSPAASPMPMTASRYRLTSPNVIGLAELT